MSEEENSVVDRLYLKSSAGPVLFDHSKHSNLVGTCATCHHDLLSSQLATTCSECHDDDVEPDDYDHAELKDIHSGECLTCHDQSQDDDQSMSCRNCHLTTTENTVGFNGCQSCHDDDYTADMMDHEEYIEVEDHTCDGCHTPKKISETYHDNCTPCHLESAPQRFGDSEGKTVCGACHLR